MHPLPQPRIEVSNGPGYRESYANSVQVRASLWDFFLSFGVISQTAPDAVQIANFQKRCGHVHIPQIPGAGGTEVPPPQKN